MSLQKESSEGSKLKPQFCVNRKHDFKSYNANLIFRKKCFTMTSTGSGFNQEVNSSKASPSNLREMLEIQNPEAKVDC